MRIMTKVAKRVKQIVRRDVGDPESADKDKADKDKDKEKEEK